MVRRAEQLQLRNAAEAELALRGIAKTLAERIGCSVDTARCLLGSPDTMTRVIANVLGDGDRRRAASDCDPDYDPDADPSDPDKDIL